MICFLLISFILNACAPIVPATTPPQLEFTPGAYVVVSDETFDAGSFLVDYPAGWRIVKTSIASDENLQVVFVAPDGESTITLSTVPSAGADSELERFVRLDNGAIVQVLGSPADDAPDDFSAIFEAVADSIR